MTIDERFDALARHLEAIDAKLEELVASERRRRLQLDPLLNATVDPKFIGAVMKSMMSKEEDQALLLSFVCPNCHGTWTKMSGEPDHSSTCPGCGRHVLPTDEEISRAGHGGERSDGAFTPEDAARFIAEHGEGNTGK